MTAEEVRELREGVYLIHWTTGGTSVASVGRNWEGAVWLAPSNWITVPNYDYWQRVASVTLLATSEGVPPDDLTRLLLAALRNPADEAGLRALQDCIGERIGPPAD
jgi:hypothetical protein